MGGYITCPKCGYNRISDSEFEFLLASGGGDVTMKCPVCISNKLYYYDEYCQHGQPLDIAKLVILLKWTRRHWMKTQSHNQAGERKR